MLSGLGFSTSTVSPPSATIPAGFAPPTTSRTPLIASQRYLPRAYKANFERTCLGGHVCGNDFYCASDNKHCCKDQGRSFCEGAIYCFNPSNESCCGNTICSAGYRCASGGNSCIFTAVSSALTSVVVATSVNAVPSGIQSDPTRACFLNAAFTSYTTPIWFTVMPSPAQSSFASANAQNTGACVPNSPARGGLSTGAKVGIGIGVPTAIIFLAVLVFLLMKRGGYLRCCCEIVEARDISREQVAFHNSKGQEMQWSASVTKQDRKILTVEENKFFGFIAIVSISLYGSG
ncbi:hypothetical protein GQ44DRAFT_802109 [Phaeosphaeriaceae sp. PMI808]|nr:hypothetical protein GQ44DRAFT_802109 [Phaeosphaeriaceae sp. PMI808]